MTQLFSRGDVERAASMESAIPVIKDAFLNLANGVVKMPSKLYLDLPEYSGDFRAMPAHYNPTKKAGIKWVNSHSKNPVKGFPSVSAILILNDPETAETLAIMDGTALTGIRTGAAGGIASKLMAIPQAITGLYIGAGVQAYYQILAQQTEMPLKSIMIYDTDIKAARSLANTIRHISSNIEVVEDLEEACKAAQVITTTTPGNAPVFQAKWVQPGTHINAIGADAKGKQELPTSLLQMSTIIVDEWEQASHSGEINNPLRSGELKQDNILGTLGECLNGTITPRVSPEQITVFDSTGLAIQDLALASHVYETSQQVKEFDFNGE